MLLGLLLAPEEATPKGRFLEALTRAGHVNQVLKRVIRPGVQDPTDALACVRREVPPSVGLSVLQLGAQPPWGDAGDRRREPPVVLEMP